uniref:Acid phosphatase-like protein 2 n=1 Tax=Haemonchus contortus TaxID=6289 RepID=A0A7I4Y3G3_HAECO
MTMYMMRKEDESDARKQYFPLFPMQRGNMRSSRALRLIALAVVIVFLTYWIFSVAYMWVQIATTWLILFSSLDRTFSEEPEREPSAKDNEDIQPKQEIPAEWREMCEFLEREWQGEEGQIDDDHFRLRGVAVVFRHGERSPLYTEDDEAGCEPFREQDREDFKNYKKLMESDDFNYFLNTDVKFANFSKIPSLAHCSAGQMTAEGALQHVKFGNYMRDRYLDSNIFSPDSRLNVTVTSSRYNRTFQSAIAFTSAFLFPSKSSVPQIHVQASNFTFLCTSRNCACNTRRWRAQFEKERYEYFVQRSPAHLQKEADLVRTHSAFSHAMDPFQILDVALGRYVCRRKPLPCFGRSYCLNYEFLSQLLNETTTRKKVMFDEGSRYVVEKMNLVEAHGVLYHIAETIANLRRFPHTNTIQIFSGHDVTLAPILIVLKVPFIDPPHYASRLVIEFYELVDSPSTKDGIFLRFLYNGKDVTKDVFFCETELNNGLCPGQKLERFVHNEIFLPLNVNSLIEVCS